jgi:pyruvate formate lyase activating enzyme
MHIGGIQKNSLIDYPGKLSSVIFFSGCNFDCPYCHNPDLARSCKPPVGGLNCEEIFHFLELRRGFLDGVVISGGEPTLQDELADLCSRIKHMGFRVKLDTNGSRPKVLKHLIEECLVDYVAMDLKTDPRLYATYIAQNWDTDPILSSVGLIMNSGIDYEFRTTCVKPIITRQTIRNIARLIQGAKFYALQRFRSDVVLHPEFFKEENYEYVDEELEQLRTIAEQYVDRCIVR